jgi:hypothetical protein
MAEPPLEDLARQAAAGDETAAELFLGRLVDVLHLLDRATLHRALHAALLFEKSQTTSPPSTSNGSAELLAWARTLWTEEELASARRDLQELREKGGGLELQDFLPELEQIVNPS